MSSCIKRHLRFGFQDQRRRNLRIDKFTMISVAFNRFNENCQRCYRPSPEMTIDEQLFSTKARCSFTQYLPSKPDKFGMKFWILAEVDSKYCFQIMPYLGRDEERVEVLGTHVVMKLSKPLWYKGYNITTDNFLRQQHLQNNFSRRGQHSSEPSVLIFENYHHNPYVAWTFTTRYSTKQRNYILLGIKRREPRQ